jgi:hypothetical protein
MLVFSTSDLRCRLGGDRRRDAWRRFSSVLYVILKLILALFVFCVGDGAMSVATLGARLPVSCGIVSGAQFGFIRNHVSASRRQASLRSASVCQRLMASVRFFRLGTVRHSTVRDSTVREG